MKSKSEMKCLYFWVKISIFIKIMQIFVNGQVKFLKFIVFIYLVLNLMLCYSTYKYLVVFTYKTCQNIFLFCLENWHFYIQVYFGKCMFCYFIDIRALSYYENDVHIVNLPNSIYYVLWYHINHWHTLKEGQVTLDCSPEFCLKPSNRYVSIKTDHAPGESLVGPFLSPELYLEHIYVWSTGWYQGSRPCGFKPGYFACFNS